MPNDTPVWPDELFLDLDHTGPVPLYFQVAERLEAAIRGGAIEPGARLENEIAIGQRLGLSRPTVRRAIQDLVDKGLLVRRRGVGTQVVRGHVTRPVELTSLYEDLSATHHRPTTRVLAHELRAADERVAADLGVDAGAPVAYLRRLRLSDGVPIALLENHLHAELAELTVEQLEQHGLYQLLRSRGVVVKIATQRIGARQATGDEPQLLQIKRGSPVLTMERLAFDGSGHAIECGSHSYRPDMYSFETTLVAK